ncbi:MAG: class I adenylate-forming enzyme family protein [Syntrophaceae bacterium]
MEGLVHLFVEAAARRYPEKIAVYHGDLSATYREIDAGANRIAHCLFRQGLKPGQRVVVVMENSLESIQAYYGILKAGGVSVEVPDRSTLSEVAYFIGNSGARACMLSKASAGRLAGIDIPLIIGPDMDFNNSAARYIPWSSLQNQPDSSPERAIDTGGLAALVYTSGSTGKPKGVMLTHANLCANTLSIASYLGLNPDDRAMVILPFHYVYGKTLLNTHFASGGSIVINNRFVFPNVVVQEMVKRECTIFAGVPSTFAFLLNRSIFNRTAIASLRIVTQAGGAMAPALTQRLRDTLKSARLYVMYGATEASARLSYLPPERLSDKLGSIGIPIPGVQIDVRDDTGAVKAPYEEGNICARGPNIMRGYWDDPDETAKALKPWGLVTGDLGYYDDEGFLFLTGRKKEMLKVGGERVSPKEIEDAIIASHLIHEAAVIGRPDKLLHEVPEAFIVPIDAQTFRLEDLSAYVQEQLAPRKQPRHWNIVKSLPKKSSGKIDKEALKS